MDGTCFLSRSWNDEDAFACSGCALTLIVGASVACYAADAETPKAVIAEVGELGENIYDLAKDKDWAKVGEKLTSLKKEAESLKSQVKEAKKRRSNSARASQPSKRPLVRRISKSPCRRRTRLR